MQVSKSILEKLIGKKLSEKEIKEAFDLHAFEVEEVEEIEGDKVFDIDVLPNRSSDALSWRGLAFELSAILGTKLKQDPLLEAEKNLLKNQGNSLQVIVEDKDYCNVYATALIEGVEVGESPDWLKKELIKMGQKPINNIVDITNYTMYMLGQPMHAFDAGKLTYKDSYKLGVRRAKKGEVFVSLDNKEYELDERVSVIFDASKEKDNILATAGIKGGLSSGTDENTKTIILESARFNPSLVRKASQFLKLRTDASKRFENDIFDQLPEIALSYAVELVLNIAGGKLKAVSIYSTEKRENKEIALDMGKINSLLGTKLSQKQAQDILKRLGFEIKRDSVKAPFWRTDIEIWQDLAEEVMRLSGFYNLKEQAIDKKALDSNLLDSYYYSELLRKFLLEKGYIEFTNSTLQDKGELKLKNALASDKNYFRDSISYCISKALDKNEANAPLFGIYDAFKVFEIGTIYKKGKESLNIAIAIRPVSKKKREKKAKQKLQEIKKEIEENFNVSLPEPGVETLEFNLLEVFSSVKKSEKYPELPVLPNIEYKGFSAFPFVLRDIAMWLDSKKLAKDAENIIRQKGGELLKRVDLFDIFEKDGRVSFAYHLVFQSDAKTLKDEEVNEKMSEIEKALQELGAEIR